MRAVVFLMLTVAGCSPTATPGSPASPRASRTATAKNVVFMPATRPEPRVRRLDLPVIPGAAAIWGATGRDHLGRIYFGVSAREGDSAHLLALNPANDQITDLGSVVDELRKLGQPVASQNKIHTKILQGPDGHMYFASMDETGEAEDGSKLPTHGSRFWQYDPARQQWRLLGSAPEGIIASAIGGAIINFLGYPGHVHYRYDTLGGTLSPAMRVGSVGGHTTRNFFADDRGHSYVPRVTTDNATLVEFDAAGSEVRASPLSHYSRTPDSSSHGLVGIAVKSSGAWLATTDRGRLFQITDGAVSDLGWLHPRGECYAASLFCLDGASEVVAIANVVPRGEPKYEWIVFDLESRKSKASGIEFPVAPGARALLVYGSLTRDDAGRCYVGGCFQTSDDRTATTPAAWCVEP